MAVTNAYRLCIGLFKQDSAGSVYSALPDDWKAIKWNLTSIIPTDYDYTNFQVGDATVETVETNTITQLTKAKKYDSGAVTPPTFSFATLLPADVKTIIGTLDALTTVDDPYKVLLCCGIYSSVASTTRTYNVFSSAVAILTQDGGRAGEAKATLGGTLGLQACHLPIFGTTDCAATMTWNTSTGAVTLVPTVAATQGP